MLEELNSLSIQNLDSVQWRDGPDGDTWAICGLAASGRD